MKKTLMVLAITTFSLNSFSQTKKVINDVASASDTLGFVKSTAENYMSDILTWKNDSIVGLGKQKYLLLKGKVTGTITSLSLYIMNPPKRAVKEVARKQLNTQLLNLCNDLSDFSTFYVKSDLFIRKGAAMASNITSVVSVIIELGTKIYDTITAIIKAKRQGLVDQLTSLCTLKDLKDLK